MQSSQAALALLTVTMALAASPASAKGQLQTRPTLVEMPPSSAATRFILANSGDAPVAAQISVFAWTQKGGEDQLLATHDVVVSPPIAQVAPGSEQVVRIIRQGTAVSVDDRAYRLVVEELPSSKRDPTTAISVRLRYVIPLFLRAAGASAPSVSCRLSANVLTCLNKGGQPAQLGKSTLSDGNGHSLPLSEGLFGYVLPLGERRWIVSDVRINSFSNNLRLDSQINGQPVTLPVTRSP